MQKVLIKHTDVPNHPPAALATGELAIEMAVPCRLWIGVPTALDPSGMKLLLQLGGEEAQFVDVIGDTMTGPLILSGLPTVELQAATKSYVDNLAGTVSGTLGNKVAKVGDTMTGFLILAANPATDPEAATKQYVDAKAGAIVQPPAFPAGTTIPFWQAAAPTGWTKVTTQNDKALRVVSSGGGGAGGSYAFSTVFTQTAVQGYSEALSQTPYHGHPSYQAAWYGGLVQATTWTGNSPGVIQTPADAAGSNVAHGHTLTMAIQYIDIIIASKT
jgi:hypothetical protein